MCRPRVYRKTIALPSTTQYYPALPSTTQHYPALPSTTQYYPALFSTRSHPTQYDPS